MLSKYALSFNNDWAHRIERHLLLGAIDVKEAIRQIEQRILGSRPSTVLDDFWDELDIAQAQFKDEIDSIKLVMNEISRIPSEYETEREARLLKPAQAAKNAAIILVELHKELRKFSAAVISQQVTNPNVEVVQALKKISVRHTQEIDETEKYTDEFKALTSCLKIL